MCVLKDIALFYKQSHLYFDLTSQLLHCPASLTSGVLFWYKITTTKVETMIPLLKKICKEIASILTCHIMLRNEN